MNLITGESADEFFGGDVPEAARHVLHQAAQAPRAEVGSLLWTAHALAPHALGIYYVLYKHHAGRREFDQAERAAQRGLLEAASQAGLASDWRDVVPERVPPDVDFRGAGPARFWLFTLKALAFIALRSGRSDDARALLAHIAALDAQAQIGSEVVADMLASVTSVTPGTTAKPDA